MPTTKKTTKKSTRASSKGSKGKVAKVMPDRKPGAVRAKSAKKVSRRIVINEGRKATEHVPKRKAARRPAKKS
jgi:hypothetical protein